MTQIYISKIILDQWNLLRFLYKYNILTKTNLIQKALYASWYDFTLVNILGTYNCEHWIYDFCYNWNVIFSTKNVPGGCCNEMTVKRGVHGAPTATAAVRIIFFFLILLLLTPSSLFETLLHCKYWYKLLRHSFYNNNIMTCACNLNIYIYNCVLTP